MLSICIPIYNCNCSQLVKSLHRQCVNEGVIFQITIIDDCSPSFHNENNSINHLTNTQLIVLEKNIGRSKIRNLFLKYSKYDYLLFIDGDLKVKHSDFISLYINEIKKNKEVVCGGLSSTIKKVPKHQKLRWKNTIKNESNTIEERLRSPFRSFMSGNFMIRKGTFVLNQFNENIHDYGHEDTFFGFELLKKQIQITHIFNPTLVNTFDNNKDFINKTEAAVKNLNLILRLADFDIDLINNVKILKTINSSKVLQKWYIKRLITLPVTINFLKKISINFSSLNTFILFKLCFAIKHIDLKDH